MQERWDVKESEADEEVEEEEGVNPKSRLRALLGSKRASAATRTVGGDIRIQDLNLSSPN